MFNPMAAVRAKGVVTPDMKSAFGAGAHNTMIQGAAMSYGSATAWGAGIGATYGGIDGALSYDGSFLGGAVHGGMVGAAGGALFKGGAGMYTTGAGAKAGAYDGGTFAWKNISNGWSAGKTTP